jgi:hypothetical protein
MQQKPAFQRGAVTVIHRKIGGNIADGSAPALRRFKESARRSPRNADWAPIRRLDSVRPENPVCRDNPTLRK